MKTKEKMLKNNNIIVLSMCMQSKYETWMNNKQSVRSIHIAGYPDLIYMKTVWTKESLKQE